MLLLADQQQLNLMLSMQNNAGVLIKYSKLLRSCLLELLLLSQQPMLISSWQ